MAKTVVLGVTGSIAAYKAAEITSMLIKQGVNVRVILTKAGAEFITPLTFESLSGAPVVCDMFTRESPWEIEHISLAKQADVFLVAPATANFIGKAAAGIADDMLTATLLATRAKVLVAPAMNTNMYQNPVVQANIEALKARGFEFIDPDTGRLACGEIGSGKLAQPSEIVGRVIAALQPRQDLAGRKLLVSAGPTVEPIDPVRFISNRSSGKMGYAIAAAAAARGAFVKLVSGPTNLAVPHGVTRIDVVSCAQMFDAINSNFEECDALIMAAAPADFIVENASGQKIKKTQNQGLELRLVPTTDILSAMGQKKGNRVLIGFAAETHDLEQNALEKLKRKNLDMIAANDVTQSGVGFGTDTNSITLYMKDGSVKQSGLKPKHEIADWLLDELVSLK